MSTPPPSPTDNIKVNIPNPCMLPPPLVPSHLILKFYSIAVFGDFFFFCDIAVFGKFVCGIAMFRTPQW